VSLAAATAATRLACEGNIRKTARGMGRPVCDRKEPGRSEVDIKDGGAFAVPDFAALFFIIADKYGNDGFRRRLPHNFLGS